MEVIKIQGEVLMSKRYWWQLYKKGWYKHKDFWGCLWWIRFKWDKEKKKISLENNLQNAKDFFVKNNFEFFSNEQMNVIGKTMRDYAEQFKILK